MRILGLKKAVGDFNRCNLNGYSHGAGYLMLDRATGRVWVDHIVRKVGTGGKEFLLPEYTEYRDLYIASPSVVRLDTAMAHLPIKMSTVRATAERLCAEWKCETSL